MRDNGGMMPLPLPTVSEDSSETFASEGRRRMCEGRNTRD